ncbi:MAG: nuclear transport factor 2 family protein [Candidatus Binatia bacterium]
MTPTENRNLERVKLWEKTWNEDVMRMVDELYAADCEVRNMITGFVVRGRDNFREVERAIQAHSPDRRMRVYRTVASGDVVAIEADVFFAGKQAQGCVFLTFDENGQIISDHSYASDPTGTTTT